MPRVILRSRLKITRDILACIRDAPLSLTRITKVSRTDWVTVSQCIELCLAKGLVSRSTFRGTVLFGCSVRGREFLREYEVFEARLAGLEPFGVKL